MSEKSVWQGLCNLIGRKDSRSSAKSLPTVEQRCPECLNALDPRWRKCPYCEAAKNAGTQSTRLPQEPARPASPPSRGPTQVDLGATSSGATGIAAEPGTGGSGRRHTIGEPDSTGALGVERHTGGRRLTGIVTTFTWSPLGQLYPVRDSRNFAGSGVVSSDNNMPCEILVSKDPTMSSAHFLILCQGGKYTISDNFSTNGTFVNGDQIDTRGVELPNNAVIKAGATVFRFQKVSAVAGHASEPSREQQGWRPGDNEETVI